MKLEKIAGDELQISANVRGRAKCVHPLCAWVFSIFLSAHMSNALASDPPSAISVETKGIGKGYEEARADAVRKAMERVLPQLVVADRTIGDNTVLRDRVISTSNGFVEEYEELSVIDSDFGYQVKAKVTVSATRIRNFVGVTTSGSGGFEGTLLGAEIQRRELQIQAEENQRRARTQILERVFERWPLAAMELELVEIEIDPRDPTKLNLDIEQRYKQSFVDYLTSTLETLSIHTCVTHFEHPGYFGAALNYMNKRTLCPRSDFDGQRKVLQDHLGQNFQSETQFSEACVYVDEERKMYCYLLEDGPFISVASNRVEGSLRRFYSRNVVTVASFFDSSGGPANSGAACFFELYNRTSKLSKAFGISLGANTRNKNSHKFGEKYVHVYKAGIRITTTPKKYRVTIPADSVDLERASRFVAVVGSYAMKRNERNSRDVTDYATFASPLASSDLRNDVCESIHDAYRRSPG